MMQPNLKWVDILKDFGDEIERRGINQCGLGISFPKYAEFWTKHVFLNRSIKNPSKLKRDVPPKFEDIFNNHYGVFYQLTIALIQINNLQSSIVDISTPLYHLGTTVDLVTRTFFALLYANGEVRFDQLGQPEYEELTRNYWEHRYQDDFRDFARRYRPVTLNIHNVNDFVSKSIPEWGSYRTFGAVRQYRNVFTHGLSPLKLFHNGNILIPKLDHISSYANARWSSGTVDMSHYAPATDVISDLAQKLISDIDKLWTVLLERMEVLSPVNVWEVLARQPYEESGGQQIGSFPKPYFYTGNHDNQENG